MSKKNSNNYFDAFVELIEFSCRAADFLFGFVTGFDRNVLPEKIHELHLIEHNADKAKHDMMQKLSADFITPIEREDIIELSHAIDDITDAIEDILRRMYMYDVKLMREDAREFCEIIKESCTAVKDVMIELKNFKKSQKIQDSLIKVHGFEEKCDSIYLNAMHKLYVSGSEPLEIMGWTEIYDRMEKCSDACEHAAVVVESVVMKNT